ncbi:RagB/SusD family nutrient uptake outer membrane protein [Maribacter sp. X9]|uniref:RagB/SusD family nutrient uptake outer membrane protein n=1 Tax=Maribacter sp. X9 TaxID=3402159 RepID=UPI003AF3FF9E
MRVFGSLMMILFLVVSCSKEETGKEQELILSGSIKVTVLLGIEPAIGATVTTVPETKTKVVTNTGVVIFEEVPVGDYKVNVVLNELEDFIYFQELKVLDNETRNIIFEIPEIPVLTEQDLDVELQLNQSYRSLQRIFDADLYMAYWGDTGTDILQTNPGANYSLDELDSYNISPQLNVVNQVWTEHYKQIRQVNRGIDYLNNPNNVVANNIDRIVSEAEFRFLRGLLYFNLLKIYGNPLLSVTAEVDLNNPPNYPQNPLTTYAQIEEDLLFAIRNLPVSGSDDRAHQLNARGLLAKVYMKMAGFPLNETHNYAKALEQLNIIDGQFELIGDYKSIFNVSNENSNSEVIFRIAFDGGQNNSSSFNDFWGPLGVSGSDALVLVPGFADSFRNSSLKFEDPVGFPIELGDGRFYNSIATFKVEGSAVVNSADPKTWRPLKWYNNEIEDVNFSSNEFDYPFLRYADILLMLAEVENEINGPTPVAYDAINQVRRRAYGNTENDVASNLSQTQFFEQVLLERKLELCFEGHRRDDLIRRGKLQEVIDVYNAANDFKKDFEPHEYIWPIPQQELDLNPNVVQNPGY